MISVFSFVFIFGFLVFLLPHYFKPYLHKAKNRKVDVGFEPTT